MTLEFAIRKKDQGWLRMPEDNTEQLLRPDTIDSNPIEGADVFTIACAGGTISFSVENFGVHVVADDLDFSEERIESVVEEITQKIGARLTAELTLVRIS